MAIGRGQSKVVALKRTAEDEVEVAPAELTASPLYGVAMLKIAMELKKADGAPLEDLITGVLGRMNLDANDFRAYLEANGGLLRTIAQRRRY